MNRNAPSEAPAEANPPADSAQSDAHVVPDVAQSCLQIEAHLAEIWVEPAQGYRPPEQTDTLHGTTEPAPPEQSDTTRIQLEAEQAQSALNSRGPFPLLASPQEPGEIGRLDGYSVLSVLGEGGMGVVFEAHDLTIDRRVAIKVLRPGETDTTLSQRFLQEARLAGSLSSDRVVTIYQVGQQNGALFIVMELLTGETLEQLLQRERALPLADALRIAREVAEGLAAAHEKKLIHRDIKPANVWLKKPQPTDSHRHVKLLDFGIARPIVLHDARPSGLTLDGRIVGTPNYMSPEQARGEVLDERTDLFSLGCLMYAMLVGKSPFERSNTWASLQAVAFEELSSISEKIPTLPPQVVRLIDQLLHKDRETRPASARHVAEALKRIESSTSGLGLKLPDLADSSMYNPQVQASRKKRIGWEVWVGALTISAAVLFGASGAWNHFMAAASPLDRAGKTAQAPAAPAPPAEAAAEGEEAEEADETPLPASADLPPIKVGILHSLSGPMAVSERPIVDAFLLAIDELNERGGLLGGRPIEPIVRDGKSNELVFAAQAEKLITEDKVVTLFGCWRSTCRKTVEQVCARHDHLLVYPTLYEGLEQSPYVIYMGGAPNQQVLPAIKWAFAFLGKRKFFIVGVDGVYSRSITEIVKDELASLGGAVVGEDYRLLGEVDFKRVAEDIKASGADIVLNTVSGMGNSGVFGCLSAAGIEPAKVPVLSLRFTEEELRTISDAPQEVVGNYSVCSYFQSLSSTDNQDFVERFHKKYGAGRVINDPMAAAYTGVYAWAVGVYDSESDQVADIRAAMIDQDVEGPEGTVNVAANHHATRSAVIGQVTPELEFDVVWSSPKAIAPEPYPASRTQEQWQEFLQQLFTSWHGNWRPDAPQRGAGE